MKAKYVLILVILCMVGIAGVYFSTAEYGEKILFIAYFAVMIMFFLSMLSIKWIKFLFQIR
jgi:hypothetical protein